MTKSSGKQTLTPYEIIAQTNRDSGPPTPSMNSPLPTNGETGTISLQSQPEQQAQAHESTEGQRRASQIIEEYANDINEDDYQFDFEDEIWSRQQSMQSAMSDSKPWEQKQAQQQGQEDEQDDLIINPRPGSEDAGEQRQPQQQAQGKDRDAGNKRIQPHDLPDDDNKKDEQDDDGEAEISLHKQPEQQAQATN